MPSLAPFGSCCVDFVEEPAFGRLMHPSADPSQTTLGSGLWEICSPVWEVPVPGRLQKNIGLSEIWGSPVSSLEGPRKGGGIPIFASAANSDVLQAAATSQETLKALPVLPTLEALNLDGCQDVDDEARESRVPTFVPTAIRPWAMGMCAHISGQTEQQLIMPRPEVEQRTVLPCLQGLIAVAQRCRSLRRFSIYWNVKALMLWARDWAEQQSACQSEIRLKWIPFLADLLQIACRPRTRASERCSEHSPAATCRCPRAENDVGSRDNLNMPMVFADCAGALLQWLQTSH